MFLALKSLWKLRCTAGGKKKGGVKWAHDRKVLGTFEWRNVGEWGECGECAKKKMIMYDVSLKC